MNTDQTIHEKVLELSKHMEAIHYILKYSSYAPTGFIGADEFATVVNAAMMDGQNNLINQFISNIEGVAEGSIIAQPEGLSKLN